MMTLHRLVVAALLAGLASAPAYAQGARQPRPLFGGGVGNLGQALGVNASIGQGLFRTNIDADEERRRRDSQVTTLSGGLTYSLEGARAGMSASVASAGQYYAELTDELLSNHGAAVGAWLQITRRTNLSVNEAVSYQPAYQGALQSLLDPRGGFLVELANDIPASEEYRLSYATSVSLSHELSRRTSLAADYTRRDLSFSERDGSQVTETAGGRLQHRISEGLGARVGYRYSTSRISDFDLDQPAQDLHTIDAGVDFSKALSLSRRTTVAFSTGSTFIETNDQFHFFLTGDVSLDHRMGRTWGADLSVGRHVNFFDGLLEPVVTNRANAGVSGQPTRRMSMGVSASAVQGQNAGGGDNTSFTVYQGSANTSVRIARFLGWNAGYGYFRSDFDSGVQRLVPLTLRSYSSATTGLVIDPWQYVSLSVNYSYATIHRNRSDPGQGQFNRHSIIASVNVAAPLYARSRRSNASR